MDQQSTDEVQDEQDELDDQDVLDKDEDCAEVNEPLFQV